MEIVGHDDGLGQQKNDHHDFTADGTDAVCGGFSARFEVGANVHDLAEEVRMHGEERAKHEGRPGKLGQVIQPTAENEYEEVSGLI